MSNRPVLFSLHLEGNFSGIRLWPGNVCEIFAGISGAGYCTNKVAQEGNGGFFIGIDPTIGGQNKSCVLQNIATFSSYIRSAGTQVRLPGEKEPLGALDLKMKIKVSSVIIAEIIRLGNS